MAGTSADLVALVEVVRTSRKYRSLAPEVVETVGAQELAKGRGFKDTVKATKSKLHQLVGAYQVEQPDYESWLALARATWAVGGDLRPLCVEMMRRHASTRERLPLLDTFYTTLLVDLPSVRTLLDLGCGLNPLALPWMPLAPDADYLACDIHQGQTAFLQEWLDIVERPGRAFVCDLLHGAPSVHADVALLLKIIPCLEQLDKGLGAQLIEAVDAKILIVSYPAQSLGGRRRGMVDYYAEHFMRLVLGRPWQVERFEFASELVFRVHK